MWMPETKATQNERRRETYNVSRSELPLRPASARVQIWGRSAISSVGSWVEALRA
jgi:hypothetical protein